MLTILTNLPLSDATVLIFTSPLFTAVMGHFWLKEKVLPPQAALMAISVGGVLLDALDNVDGLL